MSLKPQDIMAGYAMLERPKRKITRHEDARSFEVFDIEAQTKETININSKKPKVVKKKKPTGAPQTIMDTITEVDEPTAGTTYTTEGTDPIEEIKSIKDEEDTWDKIEVIGTGGETFHKSQPLPTKTIKVFTDITEQDIEVVFAHVDESVVCLFMNSNAPVRLRPKRGMMLEIEIDGERLSVYSPGVYITAKPFDCDVLFLLVNNQEEE